MEKVDLVNRPKNRKKLLRQYGLDEISDGDDTFHNLLELASLICDAPIAYISVLDDDYQYILSQKGAEFKKMAVEDSFCQHTLDKKAPLIIDDPKNDERTKNLPLVLKNPGISFYAGCPIVDDFEQNLGAFCIMDYESRTITEKQKRTLKVLGKEVIKSFRLKRELLESLKSTNQGFDSDYQKVIDLEHQLMLANQKLFEQNEQIEYKRNKLEVVNLLLKQKAEDLQLIIDVLPACISFIDTNYCYKLNNRIYEDWFGFSKNELKGQHVSLIIGEEKFKERKSFLDRALKGEVIEYELPLNGKELRVWYLPAKDHTNKITGVFIFAEDITQLKKYQAQLEASNQGLESFAYVASHDIKSPLKTIISFGNLLKKDLESQSIEYNTEFLDFIVNAASRLESLTSDLLNYAKVGKEEKVVGGSCCLNTTLNFVVKNLQEIVHQSNTTIETKVPEMTLAVSDNDLFQLLQNIIGNGIKYQADGNKPIIKISAKQESDFCKITIEDNGIGIKEEDLNKIFQPFIRLHSNKKYKGTGIGLATCKKIVEKYHSTLGISSVLNQGTTFSFSLPLAKAKKDEREDEQGLKERA